YTGGRRCRTSPGQYRLHVSRDDVDVTRHDGIVARRNRVDVHLAHQGTPSHGRVARGRPWLLGRPEQDEGARIDPGHVGECRSEVPFVQRTIPEGAGVDREIGFPSDTPDHGVEEEPEWG